MPDDDDHERRSFLDRCAVFFERCMDSCTGRLFKATEEFGTGRTLLVLAGILLLLLVIGTVTFFDVGILELAAVLGLAAVAALFVVAIHLFMASATVTIGPNNTTEAIIKAPLEAVDLPTGPAAQRHMSSRTWLRSWPWQTVLGDDRIEVGRGRRPPVSICLRRVARITLAIDPTASEEALTLIDGGGETIARVVQNKFAVAFLAALAETTGREIEYLPISGGRPTG